MPLHPRLCERGGEELRLDLAVQEPIAVLREGRVIPRRLVGAQTDEPAEQEVELEPLHQLALGPDRVERLQQHRPQQHFRRDRGPARDPVKRRERAAQSVERLVDDAPDRPQRMIPSDAPLHVHIGKTGAHVAQLRAGPAASRMSREIMNAPPTVRVSLSRRSAKLTASPSTVNSSILSSPTAPTNTSP